MVFDVEKDVFQTDGELDDLPQKQGFAQETVLELIESDEGQIILRESNSDEDPLVTIDFSAKVHEMVGGDAQSIGHHMIHAAIQAVMSKQVSRWHANVFDEEPEHYS